MVMEVVVIVVTIEEMVEIHVLHVVQSFFISTFYDYSNNLLFQVFHYF